MTKMFGFSNNEINSKPYQIFKWKLFKDNEMILRILPNYFSENKLYNRVYLHQIMNKFYLHPIDKECNLCNILNSDERYTNIQDKILKLKLIENKREKWKHVITNHMIIKLFAIIKGYNKIQLIKFYNSIATQFLNIIIAKDIQEDIVDLYKGKSVKIIFNRLDYFPYLNITDIILGESKPIFTNEDKIKELDNKLHYKDFNYSEYILDINKAQEIIDEWYEKALNFYTTYSKKEINESSLDMFENNISDVVDSDTDFAFDKEDKIPF